MRKEIVLTRGVLCYSDSILSPIICIDWVKKLFLGDTPQRIRVTISDKNPKKKKRSHFHKTARTEHCAGEKASREN